MRDFNLNETEKIKADKWIFKPWEAPPDLLLVSDVFLGNNYPHPCIDHKEGRARALAALSSIKEAQTPPF